MTTAGTNSEFGFMLASTGISGTFGSLGNSSYGWSYARGAGIGHNGTYITSSVSTWTTGDVIMMAFDAVNNSVWFGKNGVWQGTGSPNPATNTSANFTGLTGTYIPAIGGYNGVVASVNFGQQPFNYTPPTGFVALNAYNM